MSPISKVQVVRLEVRWEAPSPVPQREWRLVPVLPDAPRSHSEHAVTCVS